MKVFHRVLRQSVVEQALGRREKSQVVEVRSRMLVMLVGFDAEPPADCLGSSLEEADWERQSQEVGSFLEF
jgi:hypothetical protein